MIRQRNDDFLVEMSPEEYADYCANRVTFENGRVQMRVPRRFVVSDLAPALYARDPRTVVYGDKTCYLKPTAFAAISYVLRHGPTSFQGLCDKAILKELSDGRLYGLCSEASTAFLDAEIPFEVSGRGAVMTITPTSSELLQ